jgi:hypothetical protein
MTRMVFLLAVLLGCASARGAQVHISLTSSQPTSEAVAGGVPASLFILGWFATTDADIVAIDQVRVTLERGVLYQSLLGSNVEPPNPVIAAAFPSLTADSWITTPGPTVLIGADLPSDGLGTWADLTEDGQQTNFKFAQLTVGSAGVFSGRFLFNGPSGPEAIPFDIPFLPEPSGGLLAAMAVCGLARVRRTQDERSPGWRLRLPGSQRDKTLPTIDGRPG